MFFLIMLEGSKWRKRGGIIYLLMQIGGSGPSRHIWCSVSSHSGSELRSRLPITLYHEIKQGCSITETDPTFPVLPFLELGFLLISVDTFIHAKIAPLHTLLFFAILIYELFN